MRLLTLLGSGLWLLLHRPAPPRPRPVAQAPAAALQPPPAILDMVNHLLSHSEAELHHPHRRHDDLTPLHQAWHMLRELAVPAIAPAPGREPEVHSLYFACRLAIICHTIGQHFDLPIETGSLGWQFLRDLQQNDMQAVHDRWRNLHYDLRQVGDDDRGHYLFFLFWPRRYAQFMSGRH